MFFKSKRNNSYCTIVTFIPQTSNKRNPNGFALFRPIIRHNTQQKTCMSWILIPMQRNKAFITTNLLVQRSKPVNSV